MKTSFRLPTLLVAQSKGTEVIQVGVEDLTHSLPICTRKVTFADIFHRKLKSLQHNPYCEGIFSVLILDAGKLPFKSLRVWLYLILPYQSKRKNTSKLYRKGKMPDSILWSPLDHNIVMEKNVVVPHAASHLYTWIHLYLIKWDREEAMQPCLQPNL